MSEAILFRDIPVGSFTVEDREWFDEAITLEVTQEGEVRLVKEDQAWCRADFDLSSPISGGVRETALGLIRKMEEFDRANRASLGNQITGDKRQILEYVRSVLTRSDAHYRQEIWDHFSGDLLSLEAYLDLASQTGFEKDGLEFFEAAQAISFLRTADSDGNPDSFNDVEVEGATGLLSRSWALDEVARMPDYPIHNGPGSADDILAAGDAASQTLFERAGEIRFDIPDDSMMREGGVDDLERAILAVSGDRAVARAKGCGSPDVAICFNRFFLDLSEEPWMDPVTAWKIYSRVRTILACGPEDSYERFLSTAAESSRLPDETLVLLALLSIGPSDSLERYRNLAHRIDPVAGIPESDSSERLVMAMGEAFKPWMLTLLKPDFS